MKQLDKLLSAKQTLSNQILSESGFSGVGIRGDHLVVYLAKDDAALREKARAIAKSAGIKASIVFDIAGELRKQ